MIKKHLYFFEGYLSEKQFKSQKDKKYEKPTVWNVEGRRTGIELPFCFSNSKTS